MTTACPKGHSSEWPDWCSVCGERLADAATDPAATAAAAATTATPPTLVETPPAPTGPTCDNCGVERHEHDVFCESCGYDFASGSLPGGAAPDQTAAVGAGESGHKPMHVKVSVDDEFFAASVGDVELELPSPLPQTQIVPLPGIRILIGRQSTSRGIFPEIDIEALTGDPAVSSRHAMLERDVTGQWTLTDLGSTNGTFWQPDAKDAIEAGAGLPIEAGTSLYLGAWTKVTFDETTV